MGMKDKNTLTVHCSTCHSRDTEDGEEKCSMDWHTGIPGKTEPPENEASPLRLCVLNLPQEKVFIRLLHCKWIRTEQAKLPHRWNKRKDDHTLTLAPVG